MDTLFEALLWLTGILGILAVLAGLAELAEWFESWNERRRG